VLLFALLLLGLHEVQMSPSPRAYSRAESASEALLQPFDAGAPCSWCGLSSRRAEFPSVAGATLPHPNTAFTTLIAETRDAPAASFLARHYAPLR